MTCFNIIGVTSLHGKQIILDLQDEQTGETETESGSTYVVRLTVDDAPEILAQLNRAYAETMQRALLEVAAGGCRTCDNRRRVPDPAEPADIFRGPSIPCPTCTPRAEKKIRTALMLRPKDRIE